MIPGRKGQAIDRSDILRTCLPRRGAFPSRYEGRECGRSKAIPERSESIRERHTTRLHPVKGISDVNAEVHMAEANCGVEA